MAFQEVQDLNCNTTVAIGGKNKDGKANPTRIEGYYLGARDVASKMSKTGFAKLHVFQTEKGNVGVWGKTNLDQKLASATPGAMIRVTFNGFLDIPGKRPMYKYKVEVDTSNTIEVTANVDAVEEDAEESYETADETYEEADPASEDEALDVAPPARAVAPRAPAATPDAARQNKVKALLSGRRNVS